MKTREEISKDIEEFIKSEYPERIEGIENSSMSMEDVIYSVLQHLDDVTFEFSQMEE